MEHTSNQLVIKIFFNINAQEEMKSLNSEGKIMYKKFFFFINL